MTVFDPAAEKHLDKLKKLLALAASSVNEHESQLAATHAAAFLDRHPIPVRWAVAEGVTCKVFPMTFLRTPPETARAAMREIAAPKTLTFTEAHRVKDQTANALAKTGHLYFQKHGYCVFVSVKHVQVFF